MTEVKKGNAVWKPSHHLPVKNVPNGYRAKWCWDDPGNIARLEVEGWKHPSEVGMGADVTRTDRRGIEDGKNLTVSEIKYRELRLMYLPEEMAQSRAEYIEAKTKQNTMSMKNSLQTELNKGSDKPVNAQGKIVID